MVRLKACWYKIESQFDFLRKHAALLEHQHLSNHLEVARILDVKLQLAVSHLRSLFDVSDHSNEGGGRTPSKQSIQLNRWRYVRSKKSLEDSIADVEAWQRIFDPSWYLMLRFAHNPGLQAGTEHQLSLSSESGTVRRSTALLKAAAHTPATTSEAAIVFLPEEGLSSITREEIPGSTAQLGLRNAPGGERLYVLETIKSPPQLQKATMTRNVRDFAARLTNLEPRTFGLLRCKGVVRHSPGQESMSGQAFTFIFHVPDGHSNPRSLRQLLGQGDFSHSLSDRFRLGSELAKAVSFVHVLSFVHKNVRPEAVLLLQDGDERLGSAYLIGFEQIRTDEGHTFKVGEMSWKRNIYQHPARQGLALAEAFMMQHDIYSLGVCLLEIGLWTSFVVPIDGHDGNSEEFMAALGPSSAWSSATVKDYLLRLAKTQLPQRMGTKYADIVVTCLTCLDAGNVDFGDEDEFQDEDGIIVGVRFIERVLTRLNELVI